MALSYPVHAVLLFSVLSSLTAPAFATPNHPPLITPRADLPNPLSPPHPLTTQPANIEHALLGRDIATCGYISGNGASPLTCPAGYSCTSTVQYLQGWACCNQIQCVGNCTSRWGRHAHPAAVPPRSSLSSVFPVLPFQDERLIIALGKDRKCADYGAGVCSGELDASLCSNIYTSILSCSDSAAPSCFVYARSTHIGDLETAYSFGCGTSGGTVLVLATTTTTGEVVSALSASTTNFFATAATTDNISPTAATTDNTSPAAGGSSPNSTPSSNGAASSDSGLNTGSIIGIIIAAVGTLGTLVGVYFAWKAVQRRRGGDAAARGRALGNDGGGLYSTVRPAHGPAPTPYGAPRPVVYGAAPSYPAGHMYSGGWR